MDHKTIQQLAAIVGPKNVTMQPEDLSCYSYDGSALEYPPAAVVFPATTEEVSRIMALASATPFAVVPRGAGTGMTGGALAVEGGIVLATSRLNRIIDVDPDNGLAVAEPGVITGDLKKAAARHGLYYPPDPASFAFCTLGGNVAECAGGPAAVKYGVTRDWVLDLTVVLADGRVLHTGQRTAKGVVGYDLTRLFIGSEGTLGVITEIVVRLIPLPSARETFFVLAASIGQATALVSKILARHTPCTLEYMDRTAIAIVADRLPAPLPPETAALLLIELDGEEESVAAQATSLNTLLTKETLIAVQRAASKKEADQMWTARRAISPAAFALGPNKMGEDVVVPRSRIPELVGFCETLAKNSGLPVFTFGHAGDGNIHVNIMLDKTDPEQISRAQAVRDRLFKETVRLGGTISGEHGVGITKAAYLPLEADDTRMSVMRGLKKLFDPQNILNPGKIFPP